MDDKALLKIIEHIQNGEISQEAAVAAFQSLQTEDLGFAMLDHHRELRTGVPEVIYAEGKTVEQTTVIFGKLMQRTDTVIATRTTAKNYKSIRKVAPSAVFYKVAGIIAYERKPREVRNESKYIAVCTAGTSDMPVAEEAAVTAELLGNRVERLYDVGVAGIHRLLENADKLRQANVVIVAAGMEGALASVVGGLVDKPVIAVPTSVGYGANFGGLSALLTMLNSCASGVGVVNIDNGFGAGHLAASINKLGDN